MSEARWCTFALPCKVRQHAEQRMPWGWAIDLRFCQAAHTLQSKGIMSANEDYCVRFGHHPFIKDKGGVKALVVVATDLP